MQTIRACHVQLYRIKRASHLSPRLARRRCSSTPSKPQPRLRYARSLSVVHWCMAGGILSCFGLVEYKKRQPKDSKLIGPLMHYHKSIGLLLAGLIATRVGLRVITRAPPHLKGPKWMQMGADAGHIALYGFMIFMPATGIAMGYYGGKGGPFFFTKGIEGAEGEKMNKSLAKWAYVWHKRVGKAFEVMA